LSIENIVFSVGGEFLFGAAYNSNNIRELQLYKEVSPIGDLLLLKYLRTVSYFTMHQTPLIVDFLSQERLKVSILSLKDNLKKGGLSLVSFVTLGAFAGLLVSNIGTTYVQKQAFGSSDFNALVKHQSTPFPGMNFSKPIDVWSKNGVLKTTFVAAYRMGKIDGQPVTAMLFNGSLPGPTLHVYPGDKLEINLVNHLNETTNLHFHGFHVSPANNSDNIFIEVSPGKTFHYSVDIPKNEPLGTDWYHSHLHELSYGQVSAGLSGLIIIEGLQKLLPKPLQNITTQTFAMRDFPYDQLYVTTNNIEHDLLPLSKINTGHERLTVNGQVNPQINLTSGETQLWHLANIGPENYLTVELPGHTFHVIAEDGYPVWHVWNNNTLFLPSGKRFDVLVTATGNGTIPFRTVNNSFTQPYDHLIATVNIQGNQNVKPVSLPTTLNFQGPGQGDLSNATIAAHRVLNFSSNDVDWKYSINNQTFNPNRIDYRAKLGTAEEWKLVNLDRDASGNIHPFHIHTNHFQVMSVNGKPYNANGLQDEVIIPTQGNVVIRIPFNDYVGKIVYHCHLMFHGDYGMMGTVKIVK
jgi:FtsP/CotA-like multicopper oxidase with cupredoxin domain